MSNNIPSDYIELKYIQSTGTQYIDTGYIPNKDTTIETKINFTFFGSGTRGIFGSRVDNKNHQFVCLTAPTDNIYYLYSGYGNYSSVKLSAIELNTDYVILKQKNKLYLNEELLRTNTYHTFSTEYTVGMFSVHNANGFSNKGNKFKMYYFKIFENDTLIRDYVPVMTKSTNEVGMYDLVTKSFYTTPSSDPFIAGPTVNIIEEDPSTEIDWTKSMEQTFEYYEVDPNTWKDKKMLRTVKSSSITRDLTTETLGSATLDVDDLLGEAYIRIYLVATQNNSKHKIPLGTYLVQTPSSTYDGKIKTVSMDAYSPLLELKENMPPLGYSLNKNTNIMNEAYMIVRNNCRAPVIKTTSNKILKDHFVADPEEKWLSYVLSLIYQANYNLDLDENGQIIFSPIQQVAELQPIWEYNDDNSSILYPEITMQHDLYGIPNVVEVVAFTGVREYMARIVNDNENSPTSTVNRGREIVYRETSPNLPGFPTEAQIEEYGRNLLKQLSSVDYQISYTHGYCPVRVGDAIRLNYKRADLQGIKAKVIKQTIKCASGCQVNETAVFTKNLWM